MKIIVAEFPKSGGSWLVSMLGDALSYPKRDLYTTDRYSFFDTTLHPWYRGVSSFDLPESCVIKSHEFPDTAIHPFPAARIHLMRDCRDVVVSRYFFAKDFCVNNGLIKEFTDSFAEHAWKSASGWARFVSAWAKEDVITLSYENLLRDALGEMKRVLNILGESIADDMIQFAVQNNTKEKMHQSLAEAFKYNTFVRKGISGDWTNYFTEEIKSIVKQHAGEALVATGYTKNNDW
ncbi:MAG: sulfotransferase domain-containing protein [Dissulfurispiraceae bacterium]